MVEPARILAMETSGRHGSVALLEGDETGSRLIGEVTLVGDERTAQVLIPSIKRLLAQAEWEPRSIKLVAIPVGPGSFTGLRIGVTAAKTFAYAIGADVLGLDTLEVLAEQATPSRVPLWAILDAQRQELFTAKFQFDERGRAVRVNDSSILSQDSWLAQLDPGDQVIGPALKRLASRLRDDVIVSPTETWTPMAATVGQLAWRAYQSGQRQDLWNLLPKYLRLSAAEEKLL